MTLAMQTKLKQYQSQSLENNYFYLSVRDRAICSNLLEVIDNSSTKFNQMNLRVQQATINK